MMKVMIKVDNATAWAAIAIALYVSRLAAALCIVAKRSKIGLWRVVHIVVTNASELPVGSH